MDSARRRRTGFATQSIAAWLVLCAACGTDTGEPDAQVADGGDEDATLSDSAVRLDAIGADSAADSMIEAGPPPACDRTVCDPVAGECSGDRRCILSGGAVRCTSEPGDKEAGARCESVDECAPGLACFRTLEGGRCARVCCASDDAACDSGETCGGSNELVDGSQTNFGRCLAHRNCDVLDAFRRCESGEGCYIVSPEGETQCLRGGGATTGERCEAQEDCAPSYFCAGLAARTCVRICAIKNDSLPCPVDEGACVAYAHSPAGTGLCTLEQSERYP